MFFLDLRISLQNGRINFKQLIYVPPYLNHHFLQSCESWIVCTSKRNFQSRLNCAVERTSSGGVLHKDTESTGVDGSFITSETANH